MKEMSPCLLLHPFQNAYFPLQFPHTKIDVPLEEVVYKGAAQLSADEQALWQSLRELAARPPVAVGTAAELLNYQRFVKQHIQIALAAARVSPRWEAASGVTERLDRAFALVNSNKTSQGRQLALEVLGFASLAYKSDTASVDSGCWSICPASSFGVGQFKVPALPAKRLREPSSDGKTISGSNCNQSGPQQLHQAQHLPSSVVEQQPSPTTGHQQQQPPRRHSAPKRRATPQVLPGAPSPIMPAAPPSSSVHGEACCDEQLLSTWCPISGKRQRVLPQHIPSSNSTNSSSTSDSVSSCRLSGQQLLQYTPVAKQQVEQVQELQQLMPSSQGTPAASSSSNDSSTTAGYASNGASGHAGGLPVPVSAAQQHPAAAPCSPPSAAPGAPAKGSSTASCERGRDRQEAAAALLRLLHEDCSASKPAADVLLFNKSSQQPIVNWVGKIKHKHAGRVVELCTVSLQVPEPFLEEFPAALFAADVRHRRSVSLGRHVVCRANLAPLTEHQLAGLAAMARNQLVALCSLQTAELHLVPYFDNKSIVRMVGFLKITAE